MAIDFGKHLRWRVSWRAIQGVDSVGVCGVMAFGCVTDYLERK